MALDLLPVTSTASAGCCSPVTGSTMSAEDAERTSRTLKALADPARLRLLSIIAAHDGGEACVCDLTEPVGLSQPTVSHHLKVLTEAGFVTREKRGVWAYYTVVPDAVSALTGHLVQHLARGSEA
ncbi:MULTISPECIES: metalloregulator ArsR/SmtB family transcription factor [unclassified Cellulomonas]|uniref:ArsR/SmtB family transcription factor n=1 Tax=unclassified Cellulomonas TaxID=2620175 RepID=UPI001C4EB99A|nr:MULTISPECIES: metalloregulator ArsR/SmtB family transcription factor [unclassified Cellulomonas]MBW0254471.1 metalloregulator ArsR/SmtB family transcription factor [Cellulomonas sp. PS-H5]MCG7284699.1 metalloregulator ArsR/SmtB family transcription factor [Cellulomonas sp. ACRRI]